MHLTRFSDIGLRILMYLAREQREAPKVTITEISTQFALPRNHVVKITSRLARQGWVEATRGRSGGLRLGQAADRIRVGAVLRALEPRDELIDCVGIGCRLSPACTLRSLLAQGLEAFYGHLDGYTLADLVTGSTGTEIVSMHRQFLQTAGEPGVLT
ncbi:MAG TPA: Rrf2 family transcriptional regulator [Methylophilaceae bacterium]|nr:Rrf2 family transcriptional regulator [Methylophilaceae bacterium]